MTLEQEHSTSGSMHRRMTTYNTYHLISCLRQIMDNDTNYEARYPLVIEAMHVAQKIGYKTGIRVEPGEPEWPVIYIELPTGQVSWHMPQHLNVWDGHSTADKFERIKDFMAMKNEELRYRSW